MNTYLDLLNIVKFPHRINDDGDHFCTRAKVDIGTICNYKCKFCYYDQRRFARPLEEIKDEVKFFNELGMTSYDLSGGEPTVHPDFLSIVSFCKKYGNVSCISNGHRLSKEDFALSALKAGLTEVMFSYHGIEHEEITGVRGSETRIIKAIKNCSELDMTIRLNCTVCKENYKNLPLYVDKILELNQELKNKIFELNFIIENPWYKDFNLEQRYFDIHECGEILDILCPLLEKNDIIPNVRYIPFCAMKEKKYIVNYYQHMYDEYDWNMIYLLEPEEKALVTRETIFRKCVETIKENRKFYSKKKCGKCMYSHICDGIKDLSIPKPEMGKPILDVIQFRHGYFRPKETPDK